MQRIRKWVSEQRSLVMQRISDWVCDDDSDWVSDDDLKALRTTGLIVAGLLIVSFLAREILGLRHGEFLTALLILTVILFLIISGRIKPKSLSIFGISAQFLEDKLRETTRQLQKEQERLVFLGKLEQALKKSKGKKENLCLLYADVDGLRKTTGKLFREYRKKKKRQREFDIRKHIISELAEYLEDAFFDKAKEDDKFDLFALGEPDIIIMTRGIEREKVKEIAEAGKNSFKSKSGTHSDVTIALLCDKEIPDKTRTASELDKEAEERFNRAKEDYRGTVYAPNVES